MYVLWVVGLALSVADSLQYIGRLFGGTGPSKQENLLKRRVLLWTSIGVNLGFLGFFKYYNFFLDNFIEAFSFFGRDISPTPWTLSCRWASAFTPFRPWAIPLMCTSGNWNLRVTLLPLLPLWAFRSWWRVPLSGQAIYCHSFMAGALSSTARR